MMDNETAKFITNNVRAFDDLKKGLGVKDKKWIMMVKAWSTGYCFCGKRLKIISILITESGITRIFQCGHTLTSLSLEDAPKFEEGFSDSCLTMTERGQSMASTGGGGRITNKGNELTSVKLLCHFYKPTLKAFLNDEQESPIDVIARDTTGHEEFFQVTSLFSSDFWKELNTTNKIERFFPDIILLLRKAIHRKSKYEMSERKRLILVIDAGAGVMGELVNGLRKIPELRSTGYKEIWLTGAVFETTHRLYP